MTSAQSTISITYDEQQDRLRLLLTSKSQQQVEGVMTRRLLKGALQGLPAWLAKQVVALPSHTIVPTVEQQHAVSQFQHQTAQQQVKEQVDIEFNDEIRSFVVETLNLSAKVKPDGSQLIEMRFIAKDANRNISLSLTIEQFHQLIGAMIDKAEGWDLINPWSDKGGNTEIASPNRAIMH